MAGSLRFYGDGISFQVVFNQSFWLRVLPGSASLVQQRWMPERILGGSWTCGVSFWSFPNSFSWWWLISSMFLTRTSWHKTTHANGYHGAWPGWAVSVSVLPLKTPKEFRFLILLPTQTGQQEPSTLDPPVTLDLACLFFHLSISRSQMYYLAFSNNGWGGTSQVALVVQNPPTNVNRHGWVKRRRFDPSVGKIPCMKAWQPTPVFLTGESQRSLANYSL